MRRFLVLFATLTACVGLSTLPAAAAPSDCGLTWGSQDKTSPNYSTATVADVRAGRHECFDRLVIDLSGPAAGYLVGYVGTVTQDGSGATVPLRGGGFLQIAVFAPAYDDAGNSTYNPSNRTDLLSTSGYPTFRQVAFAGSFEGRTTFGLGVRARLPFRVSTFDNPTRVVVDVAHSW
ncbi:AMIN-like domain-containing (lipo)protein [Nocardia sp. NPDC003183]